MPLAEPGAEFVEPVVVAQVLVVDVVVGLAVVAVVELAVELAVAVLVVLAVELAVAELVVLAVAALVELAVVLVVLEAAVLVLRLHTYSAPFVAASHHLEPDIANLHSPFLRLDPSPYPAPLPHPSFDCR